MSNESDGLDLSHVTEVPGGEAFQNAVNNFNKKAAGAALNAVKRILGTVTEPFFRKGMGERYYAPDTHAYGIAFWIGGTLFAFAFPLFASLLRVFFECANLDHLARTFPYRILAVVSGGLMVIAQLRFGRESLSAVRKYRNEGRHYHTRSRGVSRYGDREIIVFLGLATALALFDLPVAALFFIGYMMNSKLKSEQDAAIMSRYLDTMDQELENEHLEDAALGECPTEMTYLYKPLSTDMHPEVRKGVAASMVGKPVMGITKPCQRRNSSQTGTPPLAPKDPESRSEAVQEQRASVAAGSSASAARAKRPAANYQTPPSPARPVKSARQGAPQSRTSSTQTRTPLRSGQVFEQRTLDVLSQECSPDIFAMFVELKAIMPNFPSDLEFLCRLGTSLKAGLDKDHQTAAKQVLQRELTPDELERFEVVLRNDIFMKCLDLRGSRDDIPPIEILRQRVDSLAFNELRKVKCTEEGVELVVIKK